MTEGYAKKRLMDKSKFVWSALHDKAFIQLKESARTAPILAKLDYDRQIFVRTDASQWGSGAQALATSTSSLCIAAALFAETVPTLLSQSTHGHLSP